MKALERWRELKTSEPYNPYVGQSTYTIEETWKKQKEGVAHPAHIPPSPRYGREEVWLLV